MTTGEPIQARFLAKSPTRLICQQIPGAFGIVHKWSHYSKQYGRISAILRYIGRRFPQVWPLVGRRATSSYLKRWSRESDTKILNLGGGGNLAQEWLTADVDPRADVFIDCSETLPFGDCMIDGLVLEEVIEHLGYLQGLQLLKECKRVLKGDGQLRLSTPDFSWFAELQSKPISAAIEDATRDFESREGRRFLETDNAPAQLIRAAALNSIFLSHGHKFVYSSESLEQLLYLAGFSFRRSIYQDTDSMLAWTDTHADRFNHPPEISMYYDAWKHA